MPELTPRATPVRADDLALLHVLEAYIETLKAENEIVNRRLAAVETRAAQESARAEGAIAELSALTELTAQAASAGPGGGWPSWPSGSWRRRLRPR